MDITPGPARRLTVAAVVAVVMTLVTTLLAAPAADAAPRDIYVATWGDNGNRGTKADPYGTIQWGAARAKPGDTVYVRGGTYVEGAGGAADPGRRDAPIVLRNYPGERVVLKGALRFTDADWWTVDGINVTKDPNRAGSLVAFNGGSNWTLKNSEIWGGTANMNLLIRNSSQEPAENFRVVDNCIHGADDSGRQSTDHNIYLYPGLDGAGGVIERNILFDAPNGANIKVGGPGDGVTGPANVRIRYNTMARGAAGVIVYRDADANLVERNLFTDHINGDATYNGAVVSILADGRTNRIRDNAWQNHPYGYRDHGSVGNSYVVSNHRQVDTGFNARRSCSGYRPTDDVAKLYGRYATAGPLPDLPKQFRDTTGSVFNSDITWLAAEGITSGCNPPANDRFCPDDPVTRGAMAAFLVRALDIPRSSLDRFRDDDGSVFERDIQGIARAGITAGCNPPTNDRYCPGRGVTRGAMAAFLVRALDLPGSSRDRFRDDDRSVFERDIQALAKAGITAGCNPPTNDRYCPDAVVTRGQMAAFLRRAIG